MGNPYDLAMTFCMERLLPLLEEKSQSKIQLIAESRGKKEDDELMLSFLRIANQGTNYIPADRFKKVNFKLEICSQDDECGRHTVSGFGSLSGRSIHTQS